MGGAGPGLIELAMIAVGLALALTGGWVFFSTRTNARSSPPPRLTDQPEPMPAGMSLPTRYGLAIGLLIAGYHLIVWAFPPSLAAVQLHRDRWWLWLAVWVVGIGLSFAMDRSERDRARARRQDSDQS